jgi:hypothetical protein
MQAKLEIAGEPRTPVPVASPPRLRSVSTLTVTREEADRYVLRDDQGRELALLRAPCDVGRGQIRTGNGTSIVLRHGWRRVIASDGGHPMVLLDRNGALVPGTGGAAQWTIRRRWKAYQGILTRADASITLRLAPLSGRRCEVEACGDWKQRDLVVLTACFALLARRRRDQIIMVTAGH